MLKYFICGELNEQAATGNKNGPICCCSSPVILAQHFNPLPVIRTKDCFSIQYLLPVPVWTFDSWRAGQVVQVLIKYQSPFFGSFWSTHSLTELYLYTFAYWFACCTTHTHTHTKCTNWIAWIRFDLIKRLPLPALSSLADFLILWVCAICRRPFSELCDDSSLLPVLTVHPLRGRLEYKYSRLVMSANSKECDIPGADSCAVMEGENDGDMDDDVVYSKPSLLRKLKAIASKVSCHMLYTYS